MMFYLAMIKTIKTRIKDKNHINILNQMARETNFVWNVLNAASRKKWKESRAYYHPFDPYFSSILKGASSVLFINSDTIYTIANELHKKMKQEKKQIRFRGRKSTKWIPFTKRNLKIVDGNLIYNKRVFKLFEKIKIDGKIKTGSFVQNSIGNWFVNISYETNELKKSLGKNQVGIDLGLKTVATCSSGEELNLNDLKIYDRKIALYQRKRKFKRVSRLHLKKDNIKNDRMNKFALNLVKTNNLIAIGNVKISMRTNLAKSRHHAAWSRLKNKIFFKSEEWQVKCVEVDERFTTQICNVCGSIEGPKGIKELSIRFWKCSCGAELNRDINAATNILKNVNLSKSGGLNHLGKPELTFSKIGH